MCIVSAIGDDFGRTWPGRHPTWPNPGIYPDSFPDIVPSPKPYALPPEVSKEEFDQVKRELEALKEALKAAKKYDEISGAPDCEMDTKIAAIRALCQAFGISLEDVFPSKKKKPH
jgi:hypothetical protein